MIKRVRDAIMSKENNEKENQNQRGGTRVFKKSSPNGKITAYLGLYEYLFIIKYSL